MIVFSECNCTDIGSVHGNCTELGECDCLPGYTGDKCQLCNAEYYRGDPGNATVACEGEFWDIVSL